MSRNVPSLTLEDEIARSGPLPGTVWCRTEAFDWGLRKGTEAELQASRVFEEGLFERVEVKADEVWPRTGRLAIEYECRGKPSGIATTKATSWVYPLHGAYLVVPTKRLHELAQEAWRQGQRAEGGDVEDGRPTSKLVLVRLCDILCCGHHVFPLTPGNGTHMSSSRKQESEHEPDY